MSWTRRSCRAALSATLAFILLPSASWAAPTYNYGATGTFGFTEAWNSNGNGQVLNSLDDAFSARFTAMEQVNVDTVTQIMFASANAAATVRVGIMADNGSGLPSGTYLTSGTHSPTTVNAPSSVSFSAVTLQAGSVYHIVTQAVSLEDGVTVTPRRSTGSNSIRPYDRATDPMMSILNRNNGGAWSGLSFDPFFSLSYGGTILGGPGQPQSASANQNFSETAGGTGTAVGQRFVITDKEVPAGAEVVVSQVRVKATTSNAPTDPLLVRFRTADGATILATATFLPADADGTYKALTLDQPVTLTQGVPYLITTQFGGSGGANGQEYNLFGAAYSGGAEAGWGGKTISYQIKSSAGNNWNIITADNTRDWAVGFTGLVQQVPEPASAALLAAGSALTAVRRRRVG